MERSVISKHVVLLHSNGACSVNKVYIYIYIFKKNLFQKGTTYNTQYVVLCTVILSGSYQQFP